MFLLFAVFFFKFVDVVRRLDGGGMNPKSRNATTHLLLLSNQTDWQNSTHRNVIGIDPNSSNDSTLLLMATTTANSIEADVMGDDDLDGDDPFWTKEQLILIENFPSNVFVVMGLIVSIIGILGLIANGMVLFIFSRYNSIIFSSRRAMIFPL